MERLPQEIVLDILSRLPIKSLLQSRSVCRAWRAITHDPLFVHKHLSRMAENDPGFILYTDGPTRSQLYFLDLSDQNEAVNVMVKKISVAATATTQFDLVGSCNGLLCLYDSSQRNPPCIYNPFTRDCLELPKPTGSARESIAVLGFGFNPTTKEYKIVKIAKVFHRTESQIGYTRMSASTYLESQVQVLTIGNGGGGFWRNLGKVPYRFIRQPANTVAGRLHWVSLLDDSYDRKLISFDLAEERFQEVPKPNCGGLEGCVFYLVGFKGCLSAARQYNRQLEIYVMQEYGKEESWKKALSFATHLPRELVLDERVSPNYSRFFYLTGSPLRALCFFKSGEILFEHKCRDFVLFDPKQGTFKHLNLFRGLPNWFEAVVHVGGLNWIHTLIPT